MTLKLKGFWSKQLRFFYYTQVLFAKLARLFCQTISALLGNRFVGQAKFDWLFRLYISIGRVQPLVLRP